MQGFERCLPVVRTTARMAAVILFATSAAFGAARASSAPVTVDIQRDDGAFSIAASAMLRADVPTAWRILTAYGEYPRFIPGIQSSHVVARRGRVVTVEQSDDALLWPMHWAMHIMYEITESPPDRLESRAVARLMPALQSHYHLTSTPDGVRLDYSGRLEAGLALREIGEWAIRRTISRQFQALADEIERNGAAVAGPAVVPK